MMRIDRIHIRGFRNFNDEEIIFLAKTLIIGANDVGKTNLLYALRLLFDKSLNEHDLELTESDYNAYSGANQIEITVTICDVFEDCLLSTFGSAVKDGTVLIRYSKVLLLCSRIFTLDQNTIVSAMPDIIKLAELVYPKKRSDNALHLLEEVLRNDMLLNSYIPASENEINLMTLHKSKGLEFNIVFHMDLYKWILPNEYGDDDAQLQDLNLHYVGVTRAIDACYLMNGSMRYRKKTDNFVQSAPSPFLFMPSLAEKRRDVHWK